MARDESTRDADEPSHLDRRGYLRLAGAAAASVTALGAGVTANARAAPVSANWQVKNRYIETGSNQLGIGCAVTDPNGEGVIDHVYIKSTASSDKPAIWVDPNRHVGHLTIRNVHIEGHADNAIYAENAEPHGSGGTVTVEDCYLHDNTRGNLRVNGGTEVRNTHIHNTGNNFPSHGYVSVGYYSYYAGSGEITMRHCQIAMDGSNTQNGSSALALMTRGSTSAYGDYGSDIPTVDVYDSQVKGDVQAHDGNIKLHNSGSNPKIDPPKGVPMTAQEAEGGTSSATGPTWSEVSGGSGGSGGSDSETESGSDDSSAGSDSRGTVLELVATANASSARYEFTVDGSVERRTSAGDVSAESGDKFAKNGDGTVTVSGVAGNGYGDSFLVDGVVTAMNLDESKWTLRYDGSEVAVSDLVLPNTLVIDGTGSPRKASSYEFAVSGRAAKNAALGSVNAYDRVGDGKITGRVVGGKDAFLYSGDITGFTLDGPATVRVEDEE